MCSICSILKLASSRNLAGVAEGQEVLWQDAHHLPCGLVPRWRQACLRRQQVRALLKQGMWFPCTADHIHNLCTARLSPNALCPVVCAVVLLLPSSVDMWFSQIHSDFREVLCSCLSKPSLTIALSLPHRQYSLQSYARKGYYNDDTSDKFTFTAKCNSNLTVRSRDHQYSVGSREPRSICHQQTAASNPAASCLAVGRQHSTAQWASVPVL